MQHSMVTKTGTVLDDMNMKAGLGIERWENSSYFGNT